jgi:RNA polymerase sigma-70 factor (ECF subfamily)
VVKRETNVPLSDINTQWTDVLEAHKGTGASAVSAQEKLIQRYGGAVYRYLLGIVRDANVADDLAQEFALKFLNGAFRNANPERGRFRNFVKSAVLNLVHDYHRRRRNQPQILSSEESAEPQALSETPPEMDERQFIESWRNELLARAWADLERQDETSQPLYVVLRFRADHPEMKPADMTVQLSTQLNKPLNENWVRQMLHRARKLFADYLLDDVIQSLHRPTQDELEQELADLGLLDYCRPALERRAG